MPESPEAEAGASRGARALVALAACLVVLYLARVLGSSPLPTDDMFYIDAAYRLQGGHYSAPRPDFPFHHYLRWAVFVPLAALIGGLGMSEGVLELQAVLWHVTIGLLLVMVLRRLGTPAKHAALAGLAPVLVPPTILAPRILSEAPMCVYLLASCALLLGATKRDRARLVLAGAMLALAVNATLVAVFAAFVPLGLYLVDRWMRRSPGDPRIDGGELGRVLVPYAAGAAGVYAGILLGEGLAFGNPLLEFEALTWFHFRHRSVSEAATWSVDPRDPVQFVFAFALNMVRQMHWWLAFAAASMAAFGVMAIDGWRDGARRAAASMWLLALAAYLVLELVAPLAIGKEPLRYLAVPVLLVTAGALVVLGAALDGARRPLRLVAAGAVAATALALFASNLRAFDPNGATVHYQTACSLVRDDVERRRPGLKRSRVLVVSEVPELPSLVWYGLACNVYSNYRLDPVRYAKRDVEPAVIAAAEVLYYVAWREPARLPGAARWRQLAPAPDPPADAPTVFVAESAPRSDAPTRAGRRAAPR